MSRAEQDLRARWALALALPGRHECPRCGRPILAGPAWGGGDLIDKADGGRLTWENTRPEHAACNRAAGAARTHRRHTRTRRWA